MSIADDALAALTAGAKGATAGMALGPVGAGVGGLIGLASSLAPHIFGEDAKPALQAAAQAITGATAEPAQIAALTGDTAALLAFKQRALEIAADDKAAERDAIVTEIQARIADTQAARAQTSQLASLGSKIAWGAPVVSVVVALGFFAAFGLLIYVPVQLDAGRAAMLNILVGVLATGFTAMLSFWLGSSAGSARKTELLAQQTPVPPSPGVIVPAADVQPSR